jgi:oligopeptidase B
MSRPIPPRPRKDPKRIEQLGRVRVDDYAWMKDDNWQAVLRDPALVKSEVREHLTCWRARSRCRRRCSRR